MNFNLYTYFFIIKLMKMIYYQICVNFNNLGRNLDKKKRLKDNGQVKDKTKRQSWNIENSSKQDHSKGTCPRLA